jgi:hypothetical protein
MFWMPNLRLPPIIGWTGFLAMAQMMQDPHYLELQVSLNITFHQ